MVTIPLMALYALLTPRRVLVGAVNATKGISGVDGAVCLIEILGE